MPAWRRSAGHDGLHRRRPVAGGRFLSGLFIWIVVRNPLRALEAGTKRVAKGELGVQIPVHSNDEIGDLAHSFNSMSPACNLRRRRYGMDPHSGRARRG